jgi:hypothetical protein
VAADLLYITFDGVLQPLAFSQVVRVVAGLGARGLRYHLLSLERPSDLEKTELRDAVEGLLRPAGVKWTPLAAASMRTPRLAAEAVARMTSRAALIVHREGARLVHARGYHSALVAIGLKRLLGIPYLFDARGYWIEERSGPGGWFAAAGAYAAGKLIEQTLYRSALAVVTLTELQANDLVSGLFGPPPRFIQVIPTCADYDAFYLRDSRPAKPQEGGCVPPEVQQRLAGKVVMGVVGALNGTYFVKETLALARLATQASPSVHLLVLSAKKDEYERELQALGMARENYTLASVEHSRMPEWLQWIDWGLLLIPETAANRAKMPTKLAEFFATGVRPMFFGCNSDAARWVERAGSGYVLPSVDDAALGAAANVLIGSAGELARLRAAREATAPHFSLVSGVERYRRFLGDCLSGEAMPGNGVRSTNDDERLSPLRSLGMLS